MALSVGELVAYLRIDGGKQADQELTGVTRSLNLTGKAAEKAGVSVGRSEVALQGAGRAAETASARSGKLRAAQLSVVAAQERYNAVLAKGGASAERLASSEASLIRAQQRLASITPRPPIPPETPGLIARSNSALLGMVETIGKLGLSLGAFELGRKALEEFGKGNELTTELNAVQAASQASDADMTKVRATAIGLGKDLTVPAATAVDAAGAITDLVKSGVALDRAMVAARPALLLASAAQVTTADSARVLGDTMDDFRLKADQAGHVANVLAAASNSAGGGLMDLFDGLKYAGPTARTVGIDVTQTSAALVLMAKSGHQGSLGGTAFANMLTRLTPVSKQQKSAMHDLGVEAWDAQGRFVGLPKVVEQLHRAMERMSPEQFQKAVQLAFGNRAKLAVYDFAHGGAAALDTFTKKLQAGDVQDYANKMNRGLKAAGSELGKEAASWAIDLNGKVQPALAATAFAVGDELPKAVSGLQHTLHPLEQEFTAVLVPALHLTADVLGLVGVGVADVGHLLEHHTGTVQVLGTVVIGMWAAWKGYTIASVAVKAIGSAVDGVRLKAMYAKDAVSGIGSGAAGVTSALSPASLALAGVGLALGVASLAWQHHQAAVQADKQAVEDYTQALKEDNGVIGESTRQQAIHALESAGAFEAARKLGIGLADVTDAALGNASALGKVNGLLATNGQIVGYNGLTVSKQADAVSTLQVAIGGNNKQVQKAIQVGKDNAEANRQSAAATDAQTAAQQALTASLVYTVDAAGNLVQGQQQVGSAVNDTTEELIKQKTAAELLKESWDALDGVAETAEQTQNAFLDSLDGLTSSVKQNGRSLDQNSAAGRKNREQLVSIIDAAKAQAQATADSVAATEGQTAGLLAGNAQLKANEDRIRKQAAALHLSKAETDALIKALGVLSAVKPVAKPDVDVNPAKAKAAALKAHLDELTKQRTALLKLNDTAATPQLAAIQAELDRLNGQVATAYVRVVSAGGVAAANHVRNLAGFAAGTEGAPDGEFTVGEQGWELVRKRGSNVQIFSHADSVRMLPQGPSVPAYAGGTTKAKPVSATLVDRAGGGAAYGIATYIKGQIPSVRHAAQELAAAVNDAFKLKGVRAEVAAVKADLANVVQARSQFAGGVVSSLAGQVDITKYGDAAGMIAALQGGSANDQKFIGEENRLKAMHVPPALIQALTKDGSNAGLDTVTGASAGDLRQIIAEYTKYSGLAQTGGSVAGNVGFGDEIAGDRRKLAADSAREAALLRSIDKLVAGIGRQTNQPVEIHLNGEVIAKAVIKSHAFAGELDEITHALTY